MKSARFWVVVLLMAGAALALHARGNVDWVPQSRPLGELPETIGRWTGRDLSMDPAVLEVLGKGSFLNRIYTPAAGAGPETGPETGLGTGPGTDQAPVTLFIAYFPTQRTGQAIHSPQNCLPGSGWTFTSSGLTALTDGAGKRYQVGEYVISDGKTRQEVLYWYRSHGRSVASDYAAKLYTLADSIRYNRTDAALIRVVTPIGAGDDQKEAHQRAVHFAEQVLPLLPSYIPD
jgi:EpsI family protein